LLFLDYTKPLAAIARKYGLSIHVYADDTQLYVSFNPKSPQELHDALKNIERCVVEIKSWMEENKLQLNEDKTEVIILGTKYMLTHLRNVTVQIGKHSIKPNTKARNLGVIFDETMSLEHHISSVCKSAYFQIRNISKIRKCLTEDATKTLVHSLVTSRLDYANSLLYGLPKVLINRLQRVQNTAARLVTRTARTEHITPVLHKLHWLPVAKRIDYKLLLLTYKAMHGEAPAYLAELLHSHKPSRKLRSGNKSLLVEARSNLCTFGDRSFAHAAPRLWNRLPQHIREAQTIESFKKQLKTHLFTST
jgi:hypothetical protein